MTSFFVIILLQSILDIGTLSLFKVTCTKTCLNVYIKVRHEKTRHDFVVVSYRGFEMVELD